MLLMLDVDGPLNPYPRITRKGHTAADQLHQAPAAPSGLGG